MKCGTVMLPALLLSVHALLPGPQALTPAAWRAVAYGARAAALDMPAGLNVESAQAMAAVARQLEINERLFGLCRPGPSVRVDAPRPAGFDVVLLDAGRSWVLMATNLSGARVRGVAHLPAPVPYAMWLNLLDGSSTAMLEELEGPRWAFNLEPWSVRVLVIDKTLK